MIWFKEYNVKEWENRVGKTIHEGPKFQKH